MFDDEKLRWMNGRFMRELALDEYERRLADHLRLTDPESASRFEAAPMERRRAACAIVQEKAQTLDEVWRLVRFLFEEPADDPRAWEKVMKPDTRPVLEAALEALKDGVAFEPDAIERALRGVVAAGDVKPKQVFQPIRVAITGSTVSPGSSSRSRRSAATSPSRGSSARSSASGTGLGDVYRKRPPRTGLRLVDQEFRSPIATAWARSRARSRESSCFVWVFTVSAPSPSLRATWWSSCRRRTSADLALALGELWRRSAGARRRRDR